MPVSRPVEVETQSSKVNNKPKDKAGEGERLNKRGPRSGILYLTEEEKRRQKLREQETEESQAISRNRKNLKLSGKY
jgi:hypothetical protein